MQKFSSFCPAKINIDSETTSWLPGIPLR